MPGMVVDVFNPSPQEAEPGRSLSFGGQPGLYGEPLVQPLPFYNKDDKKKHPMDPENEK